MVKIKKVKLAHDPAFGKKTRFIYEVGNWTFPTRKMALDHIKRRKKFKK